MTQSVELLLDAAADAEVRRQWDLLGDAGLPTARRTEPSPSHAPHITLWAGDALEPAADAALPELVRGLDLELMIRNLLLFGPHRGGYVLVRQVVGSVPLATLQQRVAGVCRADAYDNFGPGRWSPHVTLARRVDADQVGPCLRALAAAPYELATRVRTARRWDSDQQRSWLL